MSLQAGGKEAVIRFVPARQWESLRRLRQMCEHAQTLMIGLPGAEWALPEWTITGGPLFDTAKPNTRSIALRYALPPKLGGANLRGEFSDVAKALVVKRFHQSHQNAGNQRNFITATGYVAHFASASHCPLFALTPSILDQACGRITGDYRESTAYNLHKLVMELAQRLSGERLAPALHDYRYTRLKRPDSQNGIQGQRIDLPEPIAQTTSDKMADVTVYRLLGRLFQCVPRDHPSRIFVLLLSLLACIGARFLELSSMPCQRVGRSAAGRAYVRLFDKKRNQKRGFCPLRKKYLISATVPIVEQALDELTHLLAPLRETAAAMRAAHGPDLRFLQDIAPEASLYAKDLVELGIPDFLRNELARERMAGAVFTNDTDRFRKWFTTVDGVAQYCKSFFHERMVACVRVAEDGREYFPEHLLFLRPIYVGGGKAQYLPYLVQTLDHSALKRWVTGSLPKVISEYAPEFAATVDITSNKFRHTVNTLLDEGGLPELLQAEWFWRSRPQENKPYQHTTRATRLLQVRQAILNGQAEGVLADKLKYVPVSEKEAYLKARVTAVLDTGTGICVHNHAQLPCERFLQCHSDCEDFVFLQEDQSNTEELKRSWAMLMINLEVSRQGRKRRSQDWFNFQEIKRKNLERLLAEHGVVPFDFHAYLAERVGDES